MVKKPIVAQINKKPFRFSTKAGTLASLKGTLIEGTLCDQAVISVNKTAGSGIQVNQPTGNVVISANIANWTVRSSTLDLGISNPGTLSVAKIENTSQSLYIDLPPTAVYAAGDFGYILANTSSGNGNIDGNNITLNINTKYDGWLSFIDNWDYGWVATVNEKNTPIYKLLDTYKSVKIKKGFSIVKFQYKPW